MGGRDRGADAAGARRPTDGGYVNAGTSGTVRASSLEQVTIEYAGSSHALVLSSSGVARNCAIRQNSGTGVRKYNGAGLVDSSVTANGGDGVIASYSTDATPSLLSGCTVESNPQDGIVIWSGANTVSNCSVRQNAGVGIELTISSGNTQPNKIQHNTIAQNVTGGMTYAQYSLQQDARFNYWGDASGPGGVGPGTGDSIGSAYVVYDPWPEAPDSLDLQIARGGSTNREIPDTQGQTYVSAQASASADWTFEILTTSDELRYSHTQTGRSFLHAWAGLDSSAQHLPAGTYRWRLAAAGEGAPELVAAPLRGTIAIASGLPDVDIQQPVEQSDNTVIPQPESRGDR